MSARKCCIAPAPDAGTYSVVHWEGRLRKKFIVDARQMREEQSSAKFRHALCGSRTPDDIVDDPRLVTCDRCLVLLSTTRVQWHNRLLAKAKEGGS